MPTHRSTRTQRCVLATALLALVVAASSGCGVGPATDEEKISKTATTYLQALADGDTATACAQLTRRAQADRCQAALKERRPRLRPDALRSAADGSMDIDVDGDTATARLTEPEGAWFTLAPVGAEWRIDSGYTLSSAMASIPPRRSGSRSPGRWPDSTTAPQHSPRPR